MNWTLSQLRTFVTVAEHRSMTRAAQVLGYTPGAVSQHMSALRKVVGENLFVQRGRTLDLTEAAQTLLVRARMVLAAEEQAASAMRSRNYQASHLVTLGVFGSASVVGLHPALTHLAETYPHIEVRAREVDVEVMAQAVLDGVIDLGIGIDYPAAPLPPLRGLSMQVVHSEPFGVVAPAEAPKPSKVGMAQANWILPPADSLFGRAMRFACAGVGFAPKETHIVIDTAVALALAGSGLGLTMATPIMMTLAGANAVWHPVAGAGRREIVVMTAEGSGEGAGDSATATVAVTVAEVFARL